LYGWKWGGTGSPSMPPMPPQREPVQEAAPAAETERLPESLDIPELLRLQSGGQPVVVVDARTPRSLEESDRRAGGAVRVNPERPVQEAERLRLPRDAWLVVFCA
jgi:sodium/hydrogen antiporter